MQTSTLFPRLDLSSISQGIERDTVSAPRVRRPDRAQVLMHPQCVDAWVAEDHDVRPIWDVVTGLDLSAFYDGIAARAARRGVRPRTPGCGWRCGCTRRWRASAAADVWRSCARKARRTGGGAAACR